MANLIPVNIDKDTGKLKAKPNPGGGGGGPLAKGYLFQTTVADTSWVITHGENTKQVIVQIFDLSFQQVFPDLIEINTPTQVSVTFNVPQEGYAHVIFFD